MKEVFEHNPGDHEDPAATPTWIMGAIGLVILVVLYLGVTAVFRDTVRQDVTGKEFRDAVREAEAVKTRSMEKLQGPPRFIEAINPDGELEERWVIPIDEAMRLTSERLRQQQMRESRSQAEDSANTLYGGEIRP